MLLCALQLSSQIKRAGTSKLHFNFKSTSCLSSIKSKRWGKQVSRAIKRQFPRNLKHVGFCVSTAEILI